MAQHSSPYLGSSARLADILAAIQVMGSYPWATRDESKWQEKLGSPLSGVSWVTVFKEHPEFFRVNEEGGITLRWRHGYDRIYRATEQRELPVTELAALSEQDRKDLTSSTLLLTFFASCGQKRWRRRGRRGGPAACAALDRGRASCAGGRSRAVRRGRAR